VCLIDSSISLECFFFCFCFLFFFSSTSCGNPIQATRTTIYLNFLTTPMPMNSMILFRCWIAAMARGSAARLRRRPLRRAVRGDATRPMTAARDGCALTTTASWIASCEKEKKKENEKNELKMKPIDTLQWEVGTNPAETRKEFLKKKKRFFFFLSFVFGFFSCSPPAASPAPCGTCPVALPRLRLRARARWR
jgi:hypothetical protein